MKRDPATALASPIPSLPYEVEAHVFALVDVIGKANEPTQTQLDALASSYNSTADFLRTKPGLSEHLHSIHPHGSRQLGTLVRPLDITRDGFDIDLIARLEPEALAHYSGADGPQRLLDVLHSSIADYARQHGLKVSCDSRCVTIEYSGGMTADIAPVIDHKIYGFPYGDSHGLIPDKERKLYIGTNPRGYATYFKEAGDIRAVFGREFVIAMDSLREAVIEPLPDADEVLGRLLGRFVQLVKLHRNEAFKAKEMSGLAPSSVFLTTLVAQAYKAAAPQPHDSPMALLLDVVDGMNDHFQTSDPTGAHPSGASTWYLPNPTVPRSNLAEEMQDRARQEAYGQWHARLRQDLRRILLAAAPGQGLDVLVEAVEQAFGSRAGKAVTQNALEQQERNRAAQRVAIFGPVVRATGIPSLARASTVIASPQFAPSRSHTFYGRR